MRGKARQEKKEQALRQWNEVLRKAEEKLANSTKCYEKFGDEDSKAWVEEDKKEVSLIKQRIAAIQTM